MQSMHLSQPQPDPSMSPAVAAGAKASLRDYVRLLRPRQWTKNLIAYAPALFGSQLLHADIFARATGCVVAFCMASSSIYIINDLLDRERDRLHPTKRNRPLAAGLIGQNAAIGMTVVLALGACALSFSLGTGVFAIIMTYLVLMLAYSKWLKNIVLVDVFAIAAGFVLRALAGASACTIEPSAWFLLCTIMGALFLSIEKRSYEVRLLQNTATEHRKSLSAYSPVLLEKFQSVITASLVMSYALYTFHSPHGQAMLITVPFVLFAVMRYQYLSVSSELTGTPEEVLLKDVPMRTCLILWCLTCAAVIYKLLPPASWFGFGPK